MSNSIPTHAQIIVIGGGIIGCSTAYHLAKEHDADVVLLERGKLTCGTSFHAAGLVGQLRSNASITRLLKYSVELYETIEKETGLASGWKQNGGLRLANNKERWTEIKRQTTTARSFGLEMHLLSPKQAKELWPLMDASDLVGAAYLPSDGQANPSDLTMSLAKGARMHGVRIIEDITVTAVNTDKGCVTSVETDQGIINCEKLVVCAGQWSKALGLLSGVNIPLQSMQHQYMVTESMNAPADLPTLRDPDRLTYFKEEVGGLVMGGYEANPMPWEVKTIPKDFKFSLLDSNWDHFEQIMQQALIRVPDLESAGVKTLINGPESFTIDGNFILGEAPEVKNYFVGAGFNAYGIAAAGGAGKALAAWVVTGEQPMDLWVVDIRRFSAMHRDHDWVKARTIEACAKHYTMAWPHEEYLSGRPLLKSPLYDRMREHNACFGSKLGWERPNWFAPESVEPSDVYSFERQNWFDAVGTEHRLVREAVGVFDVSSFAKFELKGTDAASALQWICANDVAKSPGRLTYTQLLNSRAGIECDLTVAQLSDDEFYIVTGTGFRVHDFSWIHDHIPEGAKVDLTDVTEKHGAISLMGPNSRDVLQAVTAQDCSNAAFAFGDVRQIQISGHLVRALRVTYVGELGFELHFPIEAAVDVFDALMNAGKRFEIRPLGYRAIESLRLEKGYRAWSSDITPNDTPFEAGLGWTVKLNSPIDFIGRQAAQRCANTILTKKLAGFSVDDPNIVLLGRETILRNGEFAGYLSSGGFGYTVNKSIGYGYVRQDQGVNDDYLTNASYELVVAQDIVPASIHFKPLYDPTASKIRA